MTYYDLTIPLRSLILLVLFLEVCVGGCLLPMVFQRRNRMQRVLVPAGILGSCVLLILYTAEARATLLSQKLPAAAKWLCQQPLLLSLAIILIVFGYELYAAYQVWQFRKNTITRSSIKVGIDKLSSGLCFYNKDGRVVLVNRKMNELCFRITGSDLQNAESFLKTLEAGQLQDGVERLTWGDSLSFRLPDGSVWSFSHEVLGEIQQLSAADITQTHTVAEQLEEKNQQLTALNVRLKEHNQNVEELARVRERLEMKARVHSNLGQALLTTRKYLLGEQSGTPVPLDIWKQNIAMLLQQAEQKKEDQPMAMLSSVAKSIGVALEIHGQIPADASVETLFAQAGAEALTNAVRHAGARTLTIRLEESPQAYTITFSNDGVQPEGEIVEGGGMSSLRRKVEYSGGEMRVVSQPTYLLTVTSPKERG